MSLSSGPPELPPDSPGSSVSSRLQNEYTDIINRAVVLSNDGEKVTAAMNPLMVGSGQTKSKKKTDPANDLIDLSSPNSPRTPSESETYREQLSRIPSLHQLLSTDQRVVDNQLLNKETDDPLVPHLVRYSELVSHDLESKPINEKMDHWYLDMKKNLMNEFDKLRLQFLEEAQQVTLREKQAQAKEYMRLNQDIQTMREMLTHYERTIDQKEQTEKNLNKALDLLYNKTLAYRRYYEWRFMHLERKQQQYSLSLAKRFYEDKLKRKALAQWKSMSDHQWKKRFESACEKKAKDVLFELGQEYELKYKQLEQQLESANEEIARLKTDQGDHDEELKKAFMRGVCALNMEAMSVLLKNPNDGQTMPFLSDMQRKICEQYYQTSSADECSQPLSSSPVPRDEPPAHPPTFPSHVYKESLPSTIYRSGEARPFRPSSTTTTMTTTNPHHVRQVTFQKHPSNQRSRTRSSTTPVFVERHAPTNHIHS